MNKLFTLLKYTLYLCIVGIVIYVLYYTPIYSYLIYAIDKHDDQVLTQMIKKEDEYSAQLF